jgi:hypothetical protein
MHPEPLNHHSPLLPPKAFHCTASLSSPLSISVGRLGVRSDLLFRRLFGLSRGRVFGGDLYVRLLASFLVNHQSTHHSSHSHRPTCRCSLHARCYISSIVSRTTFINLHLSRSGHGSFLISVRGFRIVGAITAISSLH